MIKETDSQNRFPYRAVWGGIAAMFLAFGVGRFAYTPLLPLMREQTGLSLDLAGYLASLMYLGYMAGSVATTRALARFGAFTLLRAGLSMLVLGTWAMSAWNGFPFWAIVMFSLGASSAVIFLSALSLVLGVFLNYGAGWLTALLYAGIGAAIVLLGLVVPEIGAASGWQGAWRFVSCTALVGGGLCHVLLAPYRRTQKTTGHGEPAWVIPGAKRAALWLIIAYALLGFSYTIGGTFMVAMLADLPGLHDQAHLGWVLVGAAVIPSCIIWPLVAARIGEVKTTAILLALLGLANMSIVVWSSPLGVLVAAGLFGLSFLAIPAWCSAGSASWPEPGRIRLRGWRL